MTSIGRKEESCRSNPSDAGRHAMIGRTTIFRYVRHERIADYILLGWMFECWLPGPHAFWTVMMTWPCGCRPVEPIGEGTWRM